MADSQCEAQSRIQALLEYLHEREMDLEAIAESKRERLEQLVQLRNFEVEARQVCTTLMFLHPVLGRKGQFSNFFSKIFKIWRAIC